MAKSETSEKTALLSRIHPLLDSNVSNLEEQAFVKELGYETVFLRDHRLLGESILPGAAYIEMARAAGELSGRQNPFSIKNIVWLKPLKAKSQPEKIKISLHPENGTFIWRATSFEDPNETLYAQGELDYASDAPVERKAIDLESVRARLSDSKNKEECYKMFENLGLDYGPAFQVVESLSYNDDECLASLKLPEFLNEDFDSFGLHPSLLDGALHSVSGLALSGKGGSLVPFFLKEVEIIRPLEREVLAYSTFNPESWPGDKSFDIRILNQSGEALAFVDKLSVREIQPSTPERLDSLFFEAVWRPEPIEASTENFRGDVLIFDEGEALLEAFKKQFPEGEAISARPDKGVEELIEKLADEGRLPDKIIWSRGRPAEGGPDELIEKSFHGAFALTKALSGSKVRRDFRLVYPYQSESESDCFDRAVSGLARSTICEQPRLLWKTMETEDLNDSDSVLRAAMEELLSDDREAEVARREGLREVRRFNEIQLEEMGNIQSRFKDRGVYLITGGLGGLGLLTARYLAERYQARLALAGRSTIGDFGRKKLKELKKSGAEAVYIQADISKLEEVERLAREIRERFGEINGILHSAGVIRDSLILNKTRSDFETVISPKVVGSLNLDEVFKYEKLDFMVLFSSLAGALGNVGQSDYAFGNAFMDNLAAKRTRLSAEGRRFGSTVSVNWPYWAEGGMALNKGSLLPLEKTQGMFPLSTEQGFIFLEQILASGKSQVLPLLGQGEKLRSALKPPEKKIKRPTISLDDSKMTELKEKTAKWIKGILSEQLKLPFAIIKNQETWENYGIDSVMILNLIRRLERDLGELSATLFFECQNIDQLSLYLSEKYSEALLRVTGMQKSKPSPAVVAEKPKEFVFKPLRHRFASSNGDIAIVGLSGRYPGAEDLDEFWENLKKGVDSVTEIPPERWDWREYYDPQRGKRGFTYSKWGGFLKEVDKFDSLFFNISPKVAERSDPQERLFLETVWECLEDAGYSKSSLSGSKTGVFAGVMWGDYQLLGSRNLTPGKEELCGVSYASVSNRVSYFFDWHGPSLTMDTMCSSSLIAISMACHSLKSGESELAVAGGVNICVDPYKYLLLCEDNFAASDGRCRSFGAGGDGYVPGEGVGAVLLKPLEKAIDDGDRVYGVIKSAAVNHDGKTAGYTVPNPVAQGKLVKQCLEENGINPKSIGYIEAHGTGTSLGDPIELNGLKRAFSREGDEDRQYCAIGSVKSNIGHLESASGIVGLTKVLMQMKHKTLVPSIHSENLNPNINFENSPFYVQRELSEWRPRPRANGEFYPLRAGVNSFGAGGANAHLIIEEHVSETSAQVEFEPPFLIALSAKNEERLKAYSEKIVRFLKKHGDELSMADLAYTLQIGREALEERLSFLVEDEKELLSKLEEYSRNGRQTPGFHFGNYAKDDSKDKLLRDVEDRDEFLKTLVKEKKLGKLGQLWVGGLEIDWDILYGEARPRRISLPTYPFAKERHWVANSATSEKTALLSRVHPLLDSNVSNLEEQAFVKELKDNMFFLKDHRVQGESMLPGAAYIEMARAAGELSGRRKPVSIKNISWLRPLRVKGQPEKVKISLHPEDEKFFWQAKSFGDSREILYSQGELEYGSDDSGERPAIDLESVRERLSGSKTREECYEMLENFGLSYGPAFQVIETLDYNEEECLASLKLPDFLSDDFEGFGLHPSLLDGALHSVSGLALSGKGGSFVPFSLKEVEIIRPLEREVLAYSTFNPESAPDAKSFDIKILSRSGEVLAAVNKLNAREIQPSAPERLDSLCFEIVWRPEPIEASTEKFRGEVLIFDDGEALLEAFKKQFPEGEATLARPGEGVEDLIENLAYEKRLPDKIIWSRERSGEGGAEELTEKSFHGAFALTKALIGSKVRRDFRLVYPYQNDSESDCFDRAVSGLARTAAFEQPRLFWKTLETEDLNDADSVLRAAMEELLSDDREPEVARREGLREVKRFNEIQLDEADQGQSRFKDRGVYLITGGLGGLGFITARYLAERYRARLALAGRSAIGESGRQKLKELEEAGSEAVYMQADISRLEEVERLAREIKERFGEINGVLHIAGVVRDSLILNKTRSDLETVISPKVVGSLNLDEAFKDEKLDFMVFFSSIAGAFGNVGQSDYAFGNAFMDNLSAKRARLSSQGRRFGSTVSVNWPYWAGGGMVLDKGVLMRMEKGQGLFPLPAEQGFQFLERILASGKSQAMPLLGVGEKLRAILKPPEKKRKRSAVSLDDSKMTELKEKTAKWIKEVLSEELKLAPEKIQDWESWENYGVDSVVIINLTSRMEKDLGELSSTLFFECQNTDQLSLYLSEEYPEALLKLTGMKKSEPSPAPSTAVVEEKPQKPALKTRFVVSRSDDRRDTQGSRGAQGSQDSVPRDIAIVGLSGRYPGADDLDEFWENLKKGEDSVSEIPPDPSSPTLRHKKSIIW